jgi:hypothetical protein
MVDKGWSSAALVHLMYASRASEEVTAMHTDPIFTADGSITH